MKQETDKQEKSQAPPSSELSPVYYKGFWGHHKGYMQGLARGSVLGLLVGAAIGLAAVAILPYLLPALGITAAYSMGTVVAAFAGSGAVFAGHVLGRIGGGSGNVAAVHAMEELRQRYPHSDLHEMGFGHHYEYSATRDKGGWFRPKTGIPAALLGSAIGGLLGYGGIVSHLIATLGISGSVIAASPIVAPAAIVGILGLSFGVNRNKLKTLFNWTDDLPRGDLKDLSPTEKGRIEEMRKILDPNSPETLESAHGGITPRQYQSEYQRLYKEYYNSAFNSALGGNVRGIIGGMVGGSLVGVAMGALLALIPGIGIAGIALGAGFGATFATEKFTHAGAEAGGHAGAVAAWEGKKERLIESAAHTPSLRQHIAHEDNLKEQKKATEKKKFVSWRLLALGLIGGAVIGLAITPVAGHFILAAIGVHEAGALATAASSVLLGSLIGSTFGLGKDTIHGIANLGDKIYDGTTAEQLTPSPDIPAIAPDSDLHILSRAHEERKQLSQVIAAQQPSYEYESPSLPAHVHAILNNPRPRNYREYAVNRDLSSSHGAAII